MSQKVNSSKLRRLTMRTLIAGLSAACAFSSVIAQTIPDAAKRLVSIQGQDIELPEDFMARTDGNKMQVSLVALGLDSGKLKTSNLLVSLLTASGEESTAISDENGNVTFNIPPSDMDNVGVLVVPTETAHAAIGIVPTSPQNADIRNLPRKSFRLPLMQANRDEINASMVRGALPSNNTFGEVIETSGYKLRAGNPFSVRLQRDGRLLGRVVVVDRDLAANLRFAKLTFLRDNQVVARTDSNPADGSFDVPNLSAGTYGVIASGPAGYSAFSFEVLPPFAIERVGEPVQSRPISFVQPDADERLYVFLCPPKYVPRLTERFREVYSRPISDFAGAQPVPGLSMGPGVPGTAGIGGGGGGSFGGGSFGGGGGGFGGGIGGLGGLAAIAGLATVGAIVVANDDNNDTATVSPVSP